MDSIPAINSDLSKMEASLAGSLLGLMTSIAEAYEDRIDTLDESVIEEMASDMEVPADPDEAFSFLWDVASEMVDDPEAYADSITIWASYFAEFGGPHLAEVAAGGVASVDKDFVSEMLSEMGYDPKADLEDAVANIVDLAQAVLAEE